MRLDQDHVRKIERAVKRSPPPEVKLDVGFMGEVMKRLSLWERGLLMQAIDRANVVIGVLDAHDTVAEQDASLMGLVAEQGRALVLAINKWDGIPQDQRDTIRDGLDLRFDFLRFAYVHFISARHGTGVGEMMESVLKAYRAAMKELPTKDLTRALEQALTIHQPPLVRGRSIK